jgi:hypothetical protein
VPILSSRCPYFSSFSHVIFATNTRAKTLFNVLLMATGCLLGYVSALLMAASVIDEADVTVTEAVTTRPRDEPALETCPTEANVTQMVMETTSVPAKIPTSTTSHTQRFPQTLTAAAPQMPTLMPTIGGPKKVTSISDKERLQNSSSRNPQPRLWDPHNGICHASIIYGCKAKEDR